MKVRLPHWLATLPVSLALHAVAVAGVIAVLRTDATLPPLVIDLKAVVAGREDAASVPSTAPRSPTPPLSSTPPAPVTSSMPAPPEPAVVPSPSVRATDPVPARSREQSTPPRATDAATVTPTPPIPAPSPTASGPDAAPERAAGQMRGDAAASGASEPPSIAGTGGAAGRGGIGAAGDRVAAVPPGTRDGTGVRDGSGLGTEYDAYYARIRQRIQQTARYPGAARARGLAGTVELEINIAADGAVANVAIVLSSSHEILDRAAVQAARSLPRTPFPPGVRPRPLTFVIPVSFELQ